ncbi:hypothetical protein AMC90_CH02327 [Rhizobium phaseoli]|uniref:Uncharacterized protein n=2 Tax=Rhizobium TaxID=379 RepID=A0A192TCT4_9HYPH|nr:MULTISPECIES: hypothetical protein [Rhizobium]ACE91336.1 hypothetical conserved protein [Rhizobium etli CIAT 652]MDH6649822.1 hypothetical protein [Rhizobium esperanzae]ANL28144.1 hypothetical protein AMC90_CH02327 [Rhizobium phaseoli]ANL40762.1 hypothetical protein AMC88_CH02378 [Rhizobium phaseoli]ANL53497.1 hypothetical protein AMC86_CH02363 [Rhizobium phaseoli]
MERRRSRIRAAWPPYPDLVAGAPLWGMQMLVSAMLGLYLRNGLETSRLAEVAALYFLGGLLAWPFALPTARFLAYGKPPEARFAAFFVILIAATIAMTAFLFAMEYRIFYSRWHAPFGSGIWVFQFIFTSISAVYQFLVIGLRLFLPLGLVCLVASSYYLAKRMR